MYRISGFDDPHSNSSVFRLASRLRTAASRKLTASIRPIKFTRAQDPPARCGSGSPLRRFVVSIIFRYRRRVSICLKLSYVSCGTARTRESMRRNAASYFALECSPSGTILPENARCRRRRSNFYEEVATAGINIPLLAQQRYAGNCCLHRQRYSIIAVYPEFVDPPARRAAFALHLAKVLLRNDQRP